MCSTKNILKKEQWLSSSYIHFLVGCEVKNKRSYRLMNPWTHLFAITVLGALDDPLYTQTSEWRKTSDKERYSGGSKIVGKRAVEAVSKWVRKSMTTREYDQCLAQAPVSRVAGWYERTREGRVDCSIKIEGLWVIVW